MEASDSLVIYLPGATQAATAEVQETAQATARFFKVVVRHGCILLYLQGPRTRGEEEEQLLRNMVDALADGHAPGASLTSRDGHRLFTMLPDGNIKFTQVASVPGVNLANLVTVQSSQQTIASSDMPVTQRQLHIELQSVSRGDRVRLHVKGDDHTVTLPATAPGMTLRNGCSTKLFYSVPDHIQTIQYVERVAASGLTSGRVPVTDMSRHR